MILHYFQTIENYLSKYYGKGKNILTMIMMLTFLDYGLYAQI